MTDQPDLLPDESAPETVFVRFDEAQALYSRVAAEGRRVISQSLDRKRKGWECVVVRDPQHKSRE